MTDFSNLPPEEEVYARNVPGIQNKLRNAKVAICGNGGLGSNIAIALARIGVGHLHLLDFDSVEASNLNRQQFFVSHIGQPKPTALKWMIEQINPRVEVTTDIIKIDETNAYELLKDDDIICEAFDNPEAKATLAGVAGSHADLKAKPYVGGSGMAGTLSSNSIQTTQLSDNFYICGDLVNSAVMGGGLMAPRVFVCAGHEANMILRLIIGESNVDDLETYSDADGIEDFDDSEDTEW
ncbi:thiamine biosynthesis protein ThiF [Actinomycetota bacterium]|nr:thiamine biosynthesis protein ThiF [Actinomycetota bacterium]